MIYPPLGPEALFTLYTDPVRSLFKSRRRVRHVWACWSKPDDTVVIQTITVYKTMRPLAAETPAHLAIRSCRRRPCPGIDLCQGIHTQPCSMGCHRLVPSSWLHTRSTPNQWSSPRDTRRDPSSCWDMYSPWVGGKRRKQGGRETGIQIRNIFQRLSYISFCASRASAVSGLRDKTCDLSPSDRIRCRYWHGPPSSSGQAPASTLVSHLRGPAALEQHRARGGGTSSHNRHIRADGKQPIYSKNSTTDALHVPQQVLPIAHLAFLSEPSWHKPPVLHTAGITLFQWQYISCLLQINSICSEKMRK